MDDTKLVMSDLFCISEEMLFQTITPLYNKPFYNRANWKNIFRLPYVMTIHISG